jgi:hypothetical protein
LKLPLRTIIMTLFLLAVTIAPVLAQALDCPDIVETALESIDEACADTGNNQVCYGNVSIQATPQTGVANFTFERTGDLADITDLQTLQLGGLDEDTGTWGVALMRVRANIPDTLPGQNVTFLMFGDVVLENAVAEQTVLLPVTRLDADVNIRSAPDPEARQIAALVNDQTLYADGRLEDGSWVRVQNPTDEDGEVVASVGWVSAPVVAIEGDINSLPVIQSTDTTVTSGFGPMQSFYFRSGIGDSACAEAPNSGILIQTPEGVEQVNLRVNGVDVQLGSTAYFQAEPSDEMIISTIEGSASIQSQGVTQIVAAGTQAEVGLDANGIANTPPSDPHPYDLDALQALPISVLEREIEIAQPLDPSQVVALGGDLQLTLTWDNDDDMDLSILEPDGNLIWFGNTTSETGGNLDVDSIPCANSLPSVENISWGEGTDIPAGTYTAGVNEFSTCSGGANWTLTVLVGGEVVFTEQGIGGQRGVTFDYDPETGIDAESITVSDEIPQGDFGNDFDFGSGSLADYDDPDETGEIDFEETISGSIDEGGYHLWTFEGESGQTISISLTGNFDTYIQLYGPDGFLVTLDYGSGSGSTSQISSYPLFADGEYTIIVSSFTSTSGDYELSLLEGAPPPPPSEEQGSLEFGETGSGRLSEGERHSWTFEGEEDQVISITMIGDFDTYLELYGPDEEQLITDDDGYGSNLNSLISGFTLPEDGTYLIIARSYSDFASGSYELTLEEGVVQPNYPTYEPPPTPESVEQGSIEVGDTVDAELEVGERHSWTFEGEEGQEVTITMDADDNGFDTYLELYGPDGDFLTSNDDSRGSLNSQIEEFELPEDGTYTIVARSYSDFAGGDYELELEVND